MVGRKTREPRKRVYVQARMQTGERWADVTIQNVSRRGLMAYCQTPPRRGQYVEFRRSGQVLVGRVVWAAAGTFGVRTQDDIDINRLTGAASGPAYDGSERRRNARPSKRQRSKAAAPTATALERSRRTASLMDFSFIVLAGAGAAALLFGTVSNTLGEPMARASDAMAMATVRAEG